MATSLAAAIKDKLGITANMKEGHGGIFEVAIDGKVLYTNSNKCGNLPQNEDTLRMIEEHKTTGKGRRKRSPLKRSAT